MTDLVKSYASWLLKKYSSFISVPKEINDLSKAQKVWLILAFVSTCASWIVILMLPIFVIENFDDSLLVFWFVIFWSAVGLIFPLVIYWLIEAIYKLIVWIRE